MGVAKHLGIKLNEYDAVIRTFIPHYEDLIDAAAAAVDAIAPKSPVVVDLGTGTGALAAKIIAVRPKARVFGIDEDPGMLAMAHKRLPRGLFTRVGNFEREPIPECDVVSNSFALHHIRTKARKLLVYKKAYRALKRGGLLVSADSFLASRPELQREHRQLWLEHLEQTYSKKKAAAFLRAWAKEDFYVALDDERALLAQAGFSVDVCFRRDGFGVIAASRPKLR